jgi:hypothetical protein
MGLAERRGVERFKNDDYPGWKSRIDEAVGFEVPVTFDHKPHTNIDYGEERAKGLQQALESGL